MKKVILFAMTLVVFTQCKKEEQAPQAGAQKTPYPVVKVERKDITGFETFPTTLEGKNNNDVRAKINGYIQKVYVDEGQSVGRGQILFKLETNTLSEATDAAKAAVRAAQVDVDKLVPLVKKGIISKVQLETAKASLASAKAQLKQAQANANYSVIRSPISGIVGKLPFKEGSLVGPSTVEPLTTVAETSKMYAYFSMNEASYLNFLEKTEGNTLNQKLKNMPEMNLVMANGQTYAHKGEIEAATGQIDANSGTVRFRATFPNPEGLLANGASGILQLPHLYKETMVVPQSSTFEQQGMVFVYKVTGDSIAPTKVDLYDRIGHLALVKDGVAVGDDVIYQGVGKLRPGAKITPQPVKLDSVLNANK